MLQSLAPPPVEAPSVPICDPPRTPQEPAKPTESSTTASINGTSATVKSVSTGTQSQSRDKLLCLWKEHDRAVALLSKLQAEREAYSKILIQRKNDYNRSLVKHADFPSIPEVQHEHRMRYENRVNELDARIKKAQDDLNTTTESMIQIITSLSATNNKENENASSTESVKQKTLQNQKLVEEISALKTKIQTMNDQYMKEKDEKTTEFENRIKLLREEIKQELQVGYEDQLKKAREDIKQELLAEFLEEIKDLKQEVQDLRVQQQELKKQQTSQIAQQKAQQKSQEVDLQARFSKQEQELKKTIERTISAHHNDVDQVSKTETGVSASITKLLEHVDELTQQLTQRNAEEATKLREDLVSFQRDVKTQEQRLGNCEAAIGRLDIDILERAAEILSFDVPRLTKQVEVLEKAAKDVASKQEELWKRVQVYLNNTANGLAKLLDSVQTTVKGHDTRIKALEENPPVSTSSGPELSGLPSTAELEKISSTVANIKTEFDSTKLEVSDLTQKYTGLSEKLVQLNQSVTSTKKDCTEQLEFVRHSVTVLDSQFNNLSTRALAEHIIGQLELLNPAGARVLVSDFDALKQRVDAVEPKVQTLEQVCWVLQKRVLAGQLLDGLGGHGGGEGAPPAKRKRMDGPEGRRGPAGFGAEGDQDQGKGQGQGQNGNAAAEAER
ncbi:uncharacterized protein CTHT_0006160 [Thermochaetoides thermophila DSM 1495]|uniref:Uncharacterized protein n=1 Tax=Chaetomium thermophilum (strain DSM 1495 / CBS 144.50 / IMI 039719) TaxID=759272 RepID=G0RYC1_CHATD|nr:hypothetical protein CTHT_0006160 [Thermochaetoides thermophila DSM 1495]EGS23907.1 hypothetical protein CTHT_0006160 [Thermochaetoides thermophila DSM 1495]